MKKTLAAFVLGSTLVLAGCAVEADAPGTAADDVEAVQPAGDGKSKMNVNQKNAVRSANNYLDYQAFSKKGLVKQLKFEGFKQKDAQFAVNSIEVNWKKQAAKSAQDYLEYQAFSRDGMIRQLKFEGYTPEQAAHGATQAGLR